MVGEQHALRDARDLSLEDHLRLISRSLWPLLRLSAQRGFSIEGTPNKLPDSYEQDLLTIAFEAFIAMGGDAQHPECFDWQSMDSELVSRAVAIGREFFSGTSSPVGFHCSLMRKRPTLDHYSCYWSAWHEVQGGRIEDRIFENIVRDSGAFWGVLQQVLSTTDYNMLYEIYGRDRTLEEIAEDSLRAKGISEPSEKEIYAERRRLQQVVSRARTRLRERLSERRVRNLKELVERTWHESSSR